MLLRFQWNYLFIFLIAVLPQLIFFQGHAGTICSMTFNSKEEIELFKKYHSQNNDFIELLPSKTSEEVYDLTSKESFISKLLVKPSTESWVVDACAKPIACDTLVISGHFAGEFFGDEMDHELQLETMEKLSCSRKCSPMFQNVKKVFLFGCNTLAGKQQDKRTPKKYFTDLIDEHGFNIKNADVIAASRYSALGGSNNQRIRNVFPNAKEIYGFNSNAPVGSNIKNKLSSFVETFNLSEMQGNLFKQKLNGFSADFINLDNEDSKIVSSQEKSLNCIVRNNTGSIPQKLELLLKQIDIDLSQKDPKLKLAHHQELFDLTAQAKKTYNIDDFNSKFLNELRKFYRFRELKDEYFAVFKSLDDNPYSKFKLLHFFFELNWISIKNISDVMSNMILKWIKEASPINELQAMAFCFSMKEFSSFRNININIDPDEYELDWYNPVVWKVMSCSNNTNDKYWRILVSKVQDKTNSSLDEVISLTALNGKRDKDLWNMVLQLKDDKLLFTILHAFRKAAYQSTSFIEWSERKLQDESLSTELRLLIDRLIIYQSELNKRN